jgi:hypothetical protein
VVCDRQAQAAAELFLRTVCDSLLFQPAPASPVAAGPVQDSLPADLTAETLLQRFVATFSGRVRAHLLETRIGPDSPLLRHVRPRQTNGSLSDYSDHEPDSPSLIKQRPFFRRFSFKGITRGKALSFFHKAGSDEVELGPGLPREKKGKTAKTVVESRREGAVSLMAGDGMDTPGAWERTRMTLVRASGGFMLEFFSPPKASKPKNGVFCFLLTEARETTAMEMPDREATFVLRAEGHQEFIIEAQDVPDMRGWLAAIQACMRPLPAAWRHSGPPGPVSDPDQLFRDRFGPDVMDRSRSMLHFPGRGPGPELPGELPSRLGAELGSLPSAARSTAHWLRADPKVIFLGVQCSAVQCSAVRPPASPAWAGPAGRARPSPSSPTIPGSTGRSPAARRLQWSVYWVGNLGQYYTGPVLQAGQWIGIL